MGEVLRLGPVPDTQMAAYATRRARAAGKPMAAAVAARIIEVAGPVPNDIQRLAQCSFDVAGDTIDPAAVDGGMTVAVERSAAAFAQRHERLGPVAPRLVRLLADTAVDRRSTRAVLTRVEAGNDNALRKALQVLERSELAARRDGAWHVVDPFMRRWLQQL